ncbi:MAG: hypothetical protein PHU25_04375 [Deltaproteobacteria bacterium]|nr:hypothetical protein [Deltaproteobacteria bacterium]
MSIRSRKTFFVLVLVGLLTAGGGCDRMIMGDEHGCGGHHDCSGDDENDDNDDDHDTATFTDFFTDTDSATSTDTAADMDADMDTDADGDTETASDTDTGSDTSSVVCEDWEALDAHIVDSPPAGIKPTQDGICGDATSPSHSNLAARVTIDVTTASLDAAVGTVLIPDGLKGKVVGLPRISVEEAMPYEFYAMTVTGMTESADGFTFEATWPEPFGVDPGSISATMVVKVAMEIACGDGDAGVDGGVDSGPGTKTVEAVTYLDLCDGPSHPGWVSSGDECAVCRAVAEVAASPTFPVGRCDGLALPASFRLELVPVSWQGRSVVVEARCETAGRGISFSWKASAGTIAGQGGSRATWTPPADPGPHVIQVVADDGRSVAVASLPWRHRA